MPNPSELRRLEEIANEVVMIHDSLKAARIWMERLNFQSTEAKQVLAGIRLSEELLHSNYSAVT